MDIYEQITKMADEIAPELVAQRRDFHKFAEKGWFEMRTSSIIARKLTEMGYEVSVGDQVCKKDARMGVPSDEELEEQYERAVAQGADPEFVKYTKGGMTALLARKLGIDPAHIYCVGDNQNDIPMLEQSAIPFAPANCAQEVKDWGATILCHCDDGVIGDIVEILEQRY